eukprot:TRINITY_DN1795_c0_g1_i11.p1 TRINITY_DN1795_c0_g1~~TRINITY_DN1795_c0_g1_i11.p1  ORF type:complete len:647 (+),score=108.13 TRINITY_DN1795_c0_g1_i11:110-2050(+)
MHSLFASSSFSRTDGYYEQTNDSRDNQVNGPPASLTVQTSFSKAPQPPFVSKSASSSPFHMSQSVQQAPYPRFNLDGQYPFSVSPSPYSRSVEDRQGLPIPRNISMFQQGLSAANAFSPSNSDSYLFSSFPSSLDSSSAMFDFHSPKGPVGQSVPHEEELLGESAWQASEMAEHVLQDCDDDQHRGTKGTQQTGTHPGNETDDVFDIVGRMEGFELSSDPYGDDAAHGEHPSRTLRCLRIGPIKDYEIRPVFEIYGVVRSITSNPRNPSEFYVCYYDIRHAKAAMRDLHRSGKKKHLDVHYFIQKDVSADRDRNQGTLVVFNLDPSITNEELKFVFGQFGDVLEIRETPNKRHHKFVEFFDTRDAERALANLNKSELKGKKIKIEISRPGGIRGRSHSNEMDDEISSLQFSPTHGHTPTSPQDAGHYIPIIPHFDNFRLTPSILGPVEADTRMLSSSAPIMSGARDRRFSRNRVDGMDEKAMFKLDVVRVDNGEDIRTTCMIRNIPNKYTQKMLLAKVDEGHKGTYDFFYLPIDFKNKCNVGYAFINFINPRSISEFYRDFNNKRWEKFNSEKICEITYARIQGKAALVAHFQNSSLLSEDKKCRPILFHTEGPCAGEQESFPTSPTMRGLRGRQASFGRQDEYDD